MSQSENDELYGAREAHISAMVANLAMMQRRTQILITMELFLLLIVMMFLVIMSNPAIDAQRYRELAFPIGLAIAFLLSLAIFAGGMVLLRPSFSAGKQ